MIRRKANRHIESPTAVIILIAREVTEFSSGTVQEKMIRSQVMDIIYIEMFKEMPRY
jgi:hypothetical protein